MTQSTVSARVQTLEAAVGARLFTRSRAGTDLTTEGLRFETHARMLRRDWNEAKRAVAPTGECGDTCGLASRTIWPMLISVISFADFRRMFPQMAFYIEPDYSAQMCPDIVSGVHDFAVMFTPKPHPDLHFVTLGDLPYRLISSDAETRAEINPTTYISGHFSPAFEQAHRTALPELIGAPLSVGQSLDSPRCCWRWAAPGLSWPRTPPRWWQPGASNMSPMSSRLTSRSLPRCTCATAPRNRAAA